jgi:pseudouridine synthase
MMGQERGRDIGMRLQKYMAICGVASRRRSEELIAEGKVMVNHEVITQMGWDIDPERDVVFFEGKEIKPEEKKRYILLYKPRGVVTTSRDPQGRKTVLSFFRDIPERIFAVGRLDYDTEGLLILTNDGSLAYRLTHPKNEVEKTYKVWVKGLPSKEQISQLERGVLLDGRKTAPAKLVLLQGNKNQSIFRMKIYEGRNRQIRRMFQKIHHPVKALRREAIGTLGLGDLGPGQWRHLSSDEIKYLYSL